MKLFTAKSRIAFGLVCLLVSVLCTAMMIGMVPERRSAILAGRADMCETIAITSSDYVSRGELQRLEYLLQSVVERNDEILSAGVRRANGELVTHVGDHVASWISESSGRSNDSHIHVPIRSGEEKWGSVELRYRPLGKAGIAGWIESPWLQLTVFVAGASYLLFLFYLRKMLAHLDPSKAVPKRVRSALDSLAEGLLVIDKNQRIVLANQSFASWVGRDPEKLIGVYAAKLDWVKNEQKDPLGEYPWVEAIRLEAPQAGVMLGLARTNEPTRILMTNASPVLGHDGKYSGVLVSFDDVTQLEETRKDLNVAKRAAEDANQAKSEFLANMSHEIRTPMNAILGFTDILRKGYSKSERETNSHLSTIHSSGTHLLELINDILDLSKIESGHMEVEWIDCTPHAVVQEVVKVLRVKAQEKGISLDCEARTPLPETIQSDPARLRQIVTNLVGNAIKFTERGGVTVALRVASAGTETQLVIDVVDSGIGMPADKLDAIFNPFEQADTSTTRRFGGTGLGLAISRRFAQALGGDIQVCSELGKGSVFSVTIKANHAAQVRMIQPDEFACAKDETDTTVTPRFRFLPARVLVVDDGAENRELVTLVLENAGLHVDGAENGQIAVDKVLREKFDVVLMDMQMPVMDGYTATKRLREQQIETPIIALTAHAMKGFEKECLEAGCDGYLTKPIDLDRLIQTLSEFLEVDTVEQVEAAGHPVEASREAAAALNVGPTSDQPAIVSRLPTGNPRFRAIVEKFVARLDDQLHDMEIASKARDYETLAGLAHWLKGSGGTVGFDDFTKPSEALERLAKDEAGDQVEAAVRELRTLANRIVIVAEEGSATGVTV